MTVQCEEGCNSDYGDPLNLIDNIHGDYPTLAVASNKRNVQHSSVYFMIDLLAPREIASVWLALLSNDKGMYATGEILIGNSSIESGLN